MEIKRLDTTKRRSGMESYACNAHHHRPRKQNRQRSYQPTTNQLTRITQTNPPGSFPALPTIQKFSKRELRLFARYGGGGREGREERLRPSVIGFGWKDERGWSARILSVTTGSRSGRGDKKKGKGKRCGMGGGKKRKERVLSETEKHMYENVGRRSEHRTHTQYDAERSESGIVI